MLCPYCGQENINGSDQCVNCRNDLTTLDRPTGETPIEDCIIHESLAALEPKDAIIVSPDTTVQEVMAALCENNIGCVLVGTLERVEGILSERDILLRIAHRVEEVAQRPVAEFMTPDPEKLELDTPISFALNRMALGDFRHLPIVEGENLKGIISLRDFLAFLNRWYPDLIVE